MRAPETVSVHRMGVLSFVYVARPSLRLLGHFFRFWEKTSQPNEPDGEHNQPIHGADAIGNGAELAPRFVTQDRRRELQNPEHGQCDAKQRPTGTKGSICAAANRNVQERKDTREEEPFHGVDPQHETADPVLIISSVRHPI